MQTASPNLVTLLAANNRKPIIEILVQFPTATNSLQMGSSLLLDGVIAATIQRNEEASADTLDFEIYNPDGRFSPENTTGPGPVMGSTMIPGPIDKKFIPWVGLQDIGQDGIYRASYLPRGTFTLSSSVDQLRGGKPMTTGHGFDIVKEFDFSVYDDFPKTLYGNQTDMRYDANYALKTTDGGTTWVCDAKQFMQSAADSPFYADQLTALFGGSPPAGGTNVYVGTTSAPASSPVASSSYTFNSVTGTVVFTSPIAATSVVSLDGKPLGMAPELMLKHLFCDKAGWDPTYLTLQTSNLVLPTYEGKDQMLWQIAQNIAAMTAPRVVQWRIRVNAFGNIFFYEPAYAAQPVDTITDTRNIWSKEHTRTAEQIINVARADGLSNNNQSVTSVAFDIDSIKDNGQKQTQSIDSSLLWPMRGMPPTQALSWGNNLTAAAIQERARPVEELRVTLLPDPRYEPGDKLQIVSESDGRTAPWIIRGLTDVIRDGKWALDARLERAKIFANFSMGIPVAVAKQQQNQTATTTAVVLSGKTGILDSVSIGGQKVLKSGSTVKVNGMPIVPVVSTPTYSLSLTLDQSSMYDTYLWRWIYLEAKNTLVAADAMVARHPDWISGDGVKIAATTVSAGYTSTSSWTGVTPPSGGLAYQYSNLVVGVSNELLPASYNYTGVSLQYAGDTGTTPTTLGVGWGPQYSGSYAWIPRTKQTYGYYCIYAINQGGAAQFLRIPFIFQL